MKLILTKITRSKTQIIMSSYIIPQEIHDALQKSTLTLQKFIEACDVCEITNEELKDTAWITKKIQDWSEYYKCN